MSNKTKWIWNTENERWEFEQGEYLLQAYKPFTSKVWHYSTFVNYSPRVQATPCTSLSTAKRMATKWLRQHCQPADEAQAQALNLATELERLQAMEKRLKLELEYAQMQANFATVDVLKAILRGEDAPNE